MAVDEMTWVKIKNAYETENVPVARLGADFGVAVSTIYRRIKVGGWVRLGQERGVDVAAAPLGALKARRIGPERGLGRRKASQASDREGLARRLFNAIDTKLAQLEERMATAAEMTSADSERETRELANMIRSFEKVTAVAGDLDKRRGKTGKQRDITPGPEERAVDAERMRNEIAERLERLHAQRDAAGGPGGADG